MKKNGMVLLLAVLLIPLVFHFISSEVSAQTPRGVLKGAIHINISADWIDPSLSPSQLPQFMPLQLYHDALLKPMPDDLYSPCLAESWTISPDYRTYKFKLRKGVKFHNGDEMTAEDVVFTFKRYKSGPAAMLQSRIEKLEAESPYLFSVTFKQPFPDFLDYLLPGTSSIAWIVPKKYIEKVGDAEYKRHPIGCGPYKFVEFKAGGVMVGEAFENYWRKVPNIKRIEMYSVIERTSRYAMASTGEVDYALSMTDVFYERVKKDPALRMLTGQSPSYSYLHMAAQWDPKSPWSDARVRKAASLAIDRKTLQDIAYPEGGPVIDSLGLPGDPEAVHFPVDPYDPVRAKKLLAEAGYPNGFKGKFSSQSNHPGYGEMIATYLKAVGIAVELELLERPAELALVRTGKAQGAFYNDFTASPTISARLNYVFGPTKERNYPDIQALWDQYNQAIDPKARKELIGRIQKSIYDRTMVILTTRSSVPTAIGPRIKGDPFKMRGGFPIWYPWPIEDVELNEKYR